MFKDDFSHLPKKITLYHEKRKTIAKPYFLAKIVGRCSNLLSLKWYGVYSIPLGKLFYKIEVWQCYSARLLDESSKIGNWHCLTTIFFLYLGFIHGSCIFMKNSHVNISIRKFQNSVYYQSICESSLIIFFLNDGITGTYRLHTNKCNYW